MNFDKAYIIGIPQLTPSRIKKCFEKFEEQNIAVELWQGINGSEVDIEISSGPELRTVPETLVGRAYESVETAIVLEGLQVKRTEVFHPTIGLGIVIRVDPVSGSQVLADGVIEIFVSKGPEPIE